MKVQKKNQMGNALNAGSQHAMGRQSVDVPIPRSCAMCATIDHVTGRADMTKIQTSRHISGFEIANRLNLKSYLEEEFFQAIKALLSRPESELSNGMTITISQVVGQ